MNAVTEAKYLYAHAAITTVPQQEYQQIEVVHDAETRSAWTYLKPRGRACFTLGLLADLRLRDKYFEANRGQAWRDGEVFPVEYSIVASGDPQVFSWGGDLALFVMLIKARDREALLHYARACVEPAWRRLGHYGGRTTTISLVQGDALGGGFECALTSDVIIAEESVRMGFPEILFNLFPGMGAYSLLARRIGARQAEKLILGGELHKASYLHELGLVDIVVPDGQGKEATDDFIRRHRGQSNGMRALFRCREFANPITMEELMQICEVWTDAALRLQERDLRMMQRLVKAQVRLRDSTNPESAPA